MNQHYIKGVYWQPKTKKEIIESIVKSGRWNDTKTKLTYMDTKQLRAIYNRIRQDQFSDIMRKPIQQTHTQNEVKHDRTNNATGGIERADGSR